MAETKLRAFAAEGLLKQKAVAQFLEEKVAELV